MKHEKHHEHAPIPQWLTDDLQRSQQPMELGGLPPTEAHYRAVQYATSDARIRAIAGAEVLAEIQ